jgi:drug/metabolite transporter (DMT)-like permease
MPGTALAFALAAAFVHASWNILLARARDPEAATAVALLVAVAAFAFPAVVFWHVDGRVWPYVAGSAAFELFYFAVLAAAYRRAEFSVVYPIARGSAPVLVLVVAVVVLRASTSWQQAAGVTLVAAGIVFVRGSRHGIKRGGVAFGLTIGCCIAGYTLIDKYGIRYANPISYLELTMIPPAIAYAAAVARGKGLAALRAETNPAAVAAGLATFGAYALVLAALERAPAASVAAVRETSVIIAAALAGIFLKERVGWVRMAGAVAVAAGIGLISLG